MRLHYLRKLLGFPGYRVATLIIEPRRGRKSVILRLERLKRPHACGQCGRPIRYPHSSWWIEVQHLPLWEYPTFLRVQRFRVRCPECGLSLEALPFAADGPMVTSALAALVYELCKVMTVQAVGALMLLHRATVKTIDKRALEKVQAERSLEGITVLGVDEIAVGRGQTYWTMINALEGPRGPELLNVVPGRKERDLLKFWRWFGTERAKRVTHAVMDMWKPYRNSFKAHCGKGLTIIYDKFHIIRHLLDALNSVRKAELRKAAGHFRGLLAGKKFILLSRQAHVRGKAREALNDLLGASRKLLKAHLLKESFNHLWTYKSKTCARRFFDGWKDQLKWSRLKSYHKFARMVESHFDGILACCDKRVSLGYIEATNLKAKNLIRRAYGFRDKEYMRLKIIQVCTPWMGVFRPWAWAHDHEFLS
jgi:transposase